GPLGPGAVRPCVSDAQDAPSDLANGHRLSRAAQRAATRELLCEQHRSSVGTICDSGACARCASIDGARGRDATDKLIGCVARGGVIECPLPPRSIAATAVAGSLPRSTARNPIGRSLAPPRRTIERAHAIIVG